MRFTVQERKDYDICKEPVNGTAAVLPKISPWVLSDYTFNLVPVTWSSGVLGNVGSEDWFKK